MTKRNRYILFIFNFLLLAIVGFLLIVDTSSVSAEFNSVNLITQKWSVITGHSGDVFTPFRVGLFAALATILLFVVDNLNLSVGVKIKNKQYKIEWSKIALLVPISLIAIIGYQLLSNNFVCQFSIVSPKFFNNTVEFKEPQEIIEFNLDTYGADLPESKEDGSVDVFVKVKIDDKVLNTYGSIKVQGSSTAFWPKKNWTIKLYKDKTRDEKMLLKIGDSIASDEWVAKAEWIDPSMLRNSLSYKLWGDMVKTRTSTPKYEVDNALPDSSEAHDRPTDATGYPLTYPSEVRVNNEFYGLSVLTLSHDPKNFNIDENNPKHVFMEFDARGGTSLVKDWNKFNSKGDGLAIHLENYLTKDGSFSDEQNKAIDRLGKFINGPEDKFKKDFDKYFDKQNMIDMLLFIEATGDWDGVAQDLQFISYDLSKWYVLPWDKDTTFGISYDGSGVIAGLESSTIINYNNTKPWNKIYNSYSDPSHRLWFRLYWAFRPDVEKRYENLRDKGVLSEGSISNISDEVYSKISDSSWSMEREKWDVHGRPAIDEIDRGQIESWFGKKLIALDKFYGYEAPGR